MNIMQYRSYLRLFVAGLISILSHGCVYIHVTKLTDDDLEWINTYNYGDSVFFTSTHGNLDTLVVTKKFVNNSQNRFYFSEGLGPNKEANVGYHFVLRHNDESFKGWIHIIKLVGDSLFCDINVWWLCTDYSNIANKEIIIADKKTRAIPHFGRMISKTRLKNMCGVKSTG